MRKILQSPTARFVPARLSAVPALLAGALRPDAAQESSDLVERDRELEILRRAVRDVSEGMPGLLLIEGPAGIGKTRLLAEAQRTARGAGVPVLSARGSQLERSFGFGAARQLLEPPLGDPKRRSRAFAGATPARSQRLGGSRRPPP